MRVYSWNVNGIRSVLAKGALQDFINEHSPDILCLQETKAERGQVEIDLPEYREYWNSAAKKGYSGTAIFTKVEPNQVVNGLPKEVITEYKVHGDVYGDPNKEGRVITTEFEKFFVVNVYTINIKDDLSRLGLRQAWDRAFLEYCKSLEKKKPVIFCGDLNVAHSEEDLARPKENVGKRGFTNEERAGFSALVEHGFIDSFRLSHKGNGYYTWWTHWANARIRNVGWRVDYILVSASLKDRIEATEIHPDVMGSDHCPVSLTLKS